MPISVLIADHQFLTREGLYSSLKQESDLTVLTVDNWLEIQRSDLNDIPDVLILDYGESELNSENRTQLKTLVDSYHNLLIISANENKDTIREVINLGVKGFLTKNCQRDEIITAIKMISQGSRFFCDTVLEIIMEQPKVPKKQSNTLSAREFEILKLIATGSSTAEIAEKLHISVHTVNSHRKNILKKLELKSPTQLVAYAHETGIIAL